MVFLKFTHNSVTFNGYWTNLKLTFFENLTTVSLTLFKGFLTKKYSNIDFSYKFDVSIII